MPQYTIVYIPPDSVIDVEKYVAEKIQAEKDFKEKSDASSQWAPLYVIGMLALIWIIIRIRDGKNNGYVALGSIVNNETDEDIIETEAPDYLVYEGSDLHFTEPEPGITLSGLFKKGTALRTGISQLAATAAAAVQIGRAHV